MLVWKAFEGYGDVYGKLPPAKLVRNVRKLLIAQNEYDYEQQQQQKQQLEEAERARLAAQQQQTSGSRISVGR